MADSSDELEPLFDYSRVQPRDLVFLDDDDDDSSPAFPPKRQKLSGDENENKGPTNGEVVQIVDCEEDKEEEDWLPPPSKITVGAQNLRENSTIKELRLKKQELLSFAQSAEDILRTVDECAKKDLTASLQACSDSVAEPPAKTRSDRPKILISVQDKDGLKHFRVFVDDKFERLFKLYADKVKLDMKTLAFSFDGDKVSPTATPGGLGMEDDDIIEVHVKSN